MVGNSRLWLDWDSPHVWLKMAPCTYHVTWHLKMQIIHHHDILFEHCMQGLKSINLQEFNDWFMLDKCTQMLTFMTLSLKVELSSANSTACLKMCQINLCILHILCLHSAPIPGWNLGGGSDPSCRVSLTRVYTVIILLMEQTPQEGQNEWPQVWNFACYTWKSSIHCRGGGGRPGFLFTKKKMRCQTQHAGSNPTNLEEHKGGQTPAFGARDLHLDWVWTCIWVRPHNRSTV